MTNTQTFMIAAGKVDDTELTVMMRNAMLDHPGSERIRWLRQVEVALDGYGERHALSIDRVATILHLLGTEMDDGGAEMTNEVVVVG